MGSDDLKHMILLPCPAIFSNYVDVNKQNEIHGNVILNGVNTGRVYKK